MVKLIGIQLVINFRVHKLNRKQRKAQAQMAMVGSVIKRPVLGMLNASIQGTSMKVAGSSLQNFIFSCCTHKHRD